MDFSVRQRSCQAVASEGITHILSGVWVQFHEDATRHRYSAIVSLDGQFDTVVPLRWWMPTFLMRRRIRQVCEQLLIEHPETMA